MSSNDIISIGFSSVSSGSDELYSKLFCPDIICFSLLLDIPNNSSNSIEFNSAVSNF